MVTGEELKALIKSVAEGDADCFQAVSMQMASHAARMGQGKLAQELCELIDRVKLCKHAESPHQPVPIVRARGELAGLLFKSRHGAPGLRHHQQYSRAARGNDEDKMF